MIIAIKSDQTLNSKSMTVDGNPNRHGRCILLKSKGSAMLDKSSF